MNVPPAVPEIDAVPPSQVAVILNEGSSAFDAVTCSVELEGHVPDVVYKISYVFPEVPLVIKPVDGSMTAASPGAVLKLKVPPVVPVITATPPSQEGVIENEASSSVKTVTF